LRAQGGDVGHPGGCRARELPLGPARGGERAREAAFLRCQAGSRPEQATLCRGRSGDDSPALVRDTRQVIEPPEPLGERRRPEHDRDRIHVALLVQGAEIERELALPDLERRPGGAQFLPERKAALTQGDRRRPERCEPGAPCVELCVERVQAEQRLVEAGVEPLRGSVGAASLAVTRRP